MDSIEDMQLDFLDLFGVMVNGTEVPAFDQSGRRWYRLSALFQALELQGVGDGSLSSKPGNLFPNSGEFQKHKGIWYGSTEGLSQFANYLYRSQLWLTNDQDSSFWKSFSCCKRPSFQSFKRGIQARQSGLRWRHCSPALSLSTAMTTWHPASAA